MSNSYSIARGWWTRPLLLVLCGLGSVANAHPFHISLAEVEYNAKSGRFEVSLKVHASDVEHAIARTTQHKFNLEKDQRAAQLLNAYAEEHFYVTSRANLVDNDSNGDWHLLKPEFKSRMHFVGKELESTWLWLYLELEIPAEMNPKSADGLVLVNSVLLHSTEGQINTISIRHGDQKYSFKTTLKQPWVSIPELLSTTK